jgi:hypothetical protein
MPIKFKCPHCQKGLSVKEQLAGKRAACPACKKPLTIPVPTAAPADIEDLAASALADEPKPQEAAPEATTIDLDCPFCGEPIHMRADQGGQQAPCPECKRIIKVPMPAKKDPTDWRKVEARGPTLAKREEAPALEGAWGSTNKAAVSREALEEADAIPVVKEPLTLKQKIKRGLLAVGVVGVLVLGCILLMNYWAQTVQDRAVSQALSFAGGKDGKEKLKISPEAAGAVYLALGEMDLLAGKIEDARDRFRKARGRARTPTAVTFESDGVLLDLALAQVELGGTQGEKKARLPWDEAARQWGQTVKAVSPAGLTTALRQVCRRVLARAPDSLAKALIGGEPVAKPGEKTPRSRPVALLVALSRPKQAESFFSVPKEGEIEELAGRVIRDPRWKEKRDTATARVVILAATKDSALNRLQCLLSVALAALDQGQRDEAGTCVREAIRLLPDVKKEIAAAKQETAAASWLMLEWALLTRELEQGNDGQVFTALIMEPALRGRLELEKYRLQARDTKDLSDDSWSQAVPDTKVLAHGLAFQAYARNKARNGAGSEMLNKIADAQPEWIQPLAYAGVAVGLQERGK